MTASAYPLWPAAGLFGPAGGSGGEPFTLAPPDVNELLPPLDASGGLPPSRFQNFLTACLHSRYELNTVQLNGKSWLDSIHVTFLNSSTRDISQVFSAGGTGGSTGEPIATVGAPDIVDIEIREQTLETNTHIFVASVGFHHRDGTVSANGNIGPGNRVKNCFLSPSNTVIGFFGRSGTYVDALGVIYRRTIEIKRSLS